MPELSLQVSSGSKHYSLAVQWMQSEYLAGSGWPFESEGPQHFFTARARRLSLKHADLKDMQVRPCCPSQKPRPLPSAPVLATCHDDSYSNVQQQSYVDQSVAECARRFPQLWPAPTESEEMVASSSGHCDEQNMSSIWQRGGGTGFLRWRTLIQDELPYFKNGEVELPDTEI